MSLLYCDPAQKNQRVISNQMMATNCDAHLRSVAKTVNRKRLKSEKSELVVAISPGDNKYTARRTQKASLRRYLFAAYAFAFLSVIILLSKIALIITPPSSQGTHLHQMGSAEESIKAEPECGCQCQRKILEDSLSVSGHAANPGRINRLRRRTADEDPACYERLLPLFLDYSRRRFREVQNHLSLHIPKTGGTSLCKSVKAADVETSADTNCWEKEHFLPLWVWQSFGEGDRPLWRDASGKNRRMTCEEMDRSLPRFVMNENYLDHPLCSERRLYSILLRDPVERVRSHERNMLFWNRKRNRSDEDTRKRLALVRNNYATWALASGTTEHGRRLAMTPRREHLEIAKRTLSQFDFLMELSRNVTCDRTILRLMGLGEIPHANAKKGARMALLGNHSREQYVEWNTLDIELQDYARGLMDLDCEFFARIDAETMQ